MFLSPATVAAGQHVAAPFAMRARDHPRPAQHPPPHAHQRFPHDPSLGYYAASRTARPQHPVRNTITIPSHAASTATASTSSSTSGSSSSALAPGGQTSQPGARRKRASKPKVRTGCSTCKIRRIKCDETKPSCNRCTSTGRKCDGYEFTRENVRRASLSTVLSPPSRPYASRSQIFQPPSISIAFEGNTQERRLFHRFQVCTVPAFAGGSETGFWNTIVLKVGLQEDVVRNAIIALATLHEDYQVRGGEYSKDLIAETTHQHALRLYGKALRQLNEKLHKDNRPGAKLAIISSILFACFEVLRRNNMAAVIHYQAGMRELIRQINLSASDAASIEPAMSTSPVVPEMPQNELDDLLRVFARYDIQACTFSKVKAEELRVNVPLVPPTRFTLAEVKLHLDNLLFSVYQFIKSDLGMYRYWKADQVPFDWIVRRQEGVRTFETWMAALENFFQTSELKLTEADIKSSLGLRLQIKVAIIMLKTCIDCGPETSFDLFDDDFKDMVERVESMTESLQLVAAPPCHNESTSFTMELGIIHPLFFVATKCRDRSLRRRAITELKKAGREGVWEGPIMALVAERVVEIEEIGMADGQRIPERSRLHEIRKNVDYESRTVLCEATRAKDMTWRNWEVLREVVRF